MNIHIVSTGTSTFPGDIQEGMRGIMRVQLEIAKGLHSKGHNPKIVCYNEGDLPGREMHEWGEIVRIKKWNRFKTRGKDFSYLLPLFLWSLKKGCDVLHATDDPYFMYLPRASTKILHLHYYEHRNQTYPRSYFKALEKAEGVICDSEFVKKEFLRATDYPDDKTFVIYNGVNVEEFSGAPGTGLRRRIGLPDNDIVLAYAGQIEEEKGLTCLIKSFKHLSEKYRNIHLIVAGSSTLWQVSAEKSGRYEEKVKKLAEDLNVHFLGKVPVEDMPEVYGACDIFVLPSLVHEGCPLTVLESMSAGRPVVASKVGGVPELVIHGKTGLLVTPGDVDELAACIEKLVSDEMLRKKMGKEGFRRAKKFPWEKMVEEINKVYIKVEGSR